LLKFFLTKPVKSKFSTEVGDGHSSDKVVVDAGANFHSSKIIGAIFRPMHVYTCTFSL
jgi:hypothetical protein